MCGIFGMVRAQDSDPTWASNVFVALGHLAEERGSDAAGFAVVCEHGPAGAAAAGVAGTAGAAGAAGPLGPVGISAPDDAMHRPEVDLGVCRVVKDTRRWGLLWRREYLPALDAASAAFGHTRHASQGDPSTLVNASPLVVGEALVGVHNGDVDADALRRDLPAGIPPSRGGTDSEVLLALDGVRGDLLGACDVLETVRGLATVAWLDRSAPELVYLARGALCPLAIATDPRGNLYWASSPSWFRRQDERSGGRFGFEVERVPEGMLLVISACGSPLIRARCSFEPVARPGDDWRFPSIWNGIDRVDVEAFQAEASHRTAPSSPAARDPELARSAAPVG
jgi:glutamine---fructose-6-phosphate transaminase (isomerizing)